MLRLSMGVLFSDLEIILSDRGVITDVEPNSRGRGPDLALGCGVARIAGSGSEPRVKAASEACRFLVFCIKPPSDGDSSGLLGRSSTGPSPENIIVSRGGLKNAGRVGGE